jgi:hypothetical protein
MRIRTWRLFVTGGAIVVLVVAGIGIGLAAASSAQPAPGSNVALADETGAPDASRKPDRARQHQAAGVRSGKHALGWARALRLGRHLVHAEATVTDRDGNLVTLQFDHGTVESIDGTSLAISEQGGATVTVSVDDATKIWVGREQGGLGDLTAGAEIFVQSRLDDGGALARRILIAPTADS